MMFSAISSVPTRTQLTRTQLEGKSRWNVLIHMLYYMLDYNNNVLEFITTDFKTAVLLAQH